MSNKSVILIDYENLMRGHKEKIEVVMEKVEYVFNHPDLPSDIIINRAYAHYKKSDKNQDNQFRKYQIEPRQTIPFNQSGKNGADIRMVVDAMDILYTKKEIIDYVFVSGDSDFIHLYRKLKEEGKNITVFAEEKSLGQFISGYCRTIIIPTKARITKTTTTTKNKVYRKMPENKRDSLVKNLLSGLHLHKKDIPIPLFIWALNFGIGNFHIKLFGFESIDQLLDAYQNKQWLQFNRKHRIIQLKANTILDPKKITNWVAPIIIQLAISQRYKSFQFTPFGNHYALLKIAVISIQDFQLDDLINIYEYKKALMLHLDLKNIELEHIENLLFLLIQIGVLELREGNKCFSKCQKMNQEDILIAHNNFLRKNCLESKMNLNKFEWQSILDKALR